METISKIIYLHKDDDENKDNENKKLEVPMSDMFIESAKKLSNLIKGLPLSNEDNNRLVEMLLEHTKVTLNEGIIVGFNTACDIIAEHVDIADIDET